MSRNAGTLGYLNPRCFGSGLDLLETGGELGSEQLIRSCVGTPLLVRNEAKCIPRVLLPAQHSCET